MTGSRRPLRLRLGGTEMTEAGMSLAGMIAVIAALHIVGWFVLLVVVVPEHLSAGGKAFGIGIGIAAYALGMRHAFDADHIAAIDNTTRKLMRESRRPLSVGFWFSLGHSSVVFGLALLIALGIRSVIDPVLDEHSPLHIVAGLTGTIVSSGFLYVVAALNLVVLAELWRAVRELRGGRFDEASLGNRLDSHGFINPLVRLVMRFVGSPWQMYFVGLLFGLGFDTATEITLLLLTTSGAASGLPWYAILCLPVLFAAGMTLLDTIDGAFMSLAYGWALTKPTRKIYYNLVVTALSVLVALVIGTIEIVAFLGDSLDLNRAPWTWARLVDTNSMGFVVVGLFGVTWAIAVVIRKRGNADNCRRVAVGNEPQ